MSFAVGSLVKTRGREWIVLPDSTDEFFLLRPLGGGDDQIAGVYAPLEKVEDATFPLPDPGAHGDASSCRLLRDAVRLGFRNSAGPFRSFARLNVDPRAYQLVPLLLALRLDPIRLLIGDDVGIGKTIEAALIAREMLDRGEINRTCVLCPPHLAEQWQRELAEKFHINAELVLSGTVRRLERTCPGGVSIFEHYPHVVVSIDFIKADRRRDDFLRVCPEFVIVDEAHGCAAATGATKGRQQRHQVIKGLSENGNRHLILVTATPHSGKDEAFRSLLALLKPEFAELPDDLSGEENRSQRRELARHFVLRRRPDIAHYLKEDTAFPERETSEATYTLAEDYRTLFTKVLAYVREEVQSDDGRSHRQRVRWWAALGILRALASSPAAAAETLRRRASAAAGQDADEAERLGRAAVLDESDDGALETMDVAPGADAGEFSADEAGNRRRLRGFAAMADKLHGKSDAKLQTGLEEIVTLIDEGHHPIVFCRFIETAEYLAENLRHYRKLPKGTNVAAVTGRLAPAAREAEIQRLGQSERRVLVATDCISEGINLQEHFDAVIHYDLSWSPTRHEQREGRVDRFGQTKPAVRILTYWGVDNAIDGIVLDVLLRKHETIRKALGISVAMPLRTNDVLDAIFEGLVLREDTGTDSQMLLPMMNDFIRKQQLEVSRQWDAAADREKRSRSLFSHRPIKPEEIHKELKAARSAVGSGAEVETFVTSALHRSGAFVTPSNGGIKVDLRETSIGLRDLLGLGDRFKAAFTPPGGEGKQLLTRTHPAVEALAAHVMETALDPETKGIARRCGVMRTDAVSRRTTLVLSRIRFHVVTRTKGGEHPLLAEDVAQVAFQGSPTSPEWLPESETLALLDARPAANISSDLARNHLEGVLENFDPVIAHLEKEAHRHADELLDAHTRVRVSAKAGGRVRVKAQLPVDVLGVFIFLPAGGAR